MMIFKSGPFLNSPAFGMIRYFVVHLGYTEVQCAILSPLKEQWSLDRLARVFSYNI